VTDRIDDAIAAGEPISMTQLQVNLASTGRPVMLAVPIDLTDSELIEFIGWLGTGFSASRKPKSPIALARSLPGLS
jgi:hypothetical protein